MAITLIWPVLCFVLKKGNIVGAPMNFKFYIILRLSLTFLILMVTLLIVIYV